MGYTCTQETVLSCLILFAVKNRGRPPVARSSLSRMVTNLDNTDDNSGCSQDKPPTGELFKALYLRFRSFPSSMERSQTKNAFESALSFSDSSHRLSFKYDMISFKPDRTSHSVRSFVLLFLE